MRTGSLASFGLCVTVEYLLMWCSGVLPACYGEVVYVASMTLLMKTFTWLFDQFAKVLQKF